MERGDGVRPSGAAVSAGRRNDAGAPVSVLVLGGSGFVGLNVADAFHRAGQPVAIFDRSPPPAGFAVPVETHLGDVRDADALGAAMAQGLDTLVLGAAVTAGTAREARDPDTILSVNLGALPSILALARDRGVRRIVNLSSGAAYGAATATVSELDETTPSTPTSLYAVTKFASERVADRLAAHWGLDVVSLRLSAVFGPWERDTGLRDTLSAPAQILAALAEGRPALLDRPGERDWIDVRDVAEAVVAVATAKVRPAHALYNVSTGRRWGALDFGRALAALHPGFVCRLAEAGEEPNIDLHLSIDRPNLATERLAAEFGWRARFGMEESAAALLAWHDRVAAEVAS